MYSFFFLFFALSCDFISLNKVILFYFCRFSLRLFLRRPGHVHGGFRVDCRGPTESTDFVDKMQGIFNSRTDALQVSDQNVNDEILDISRSSRLTRRAISCRGRFTKTISRRQLHRVELHPLPYPVRQGDAIWKGGLVLLAFLRPSSCRRTSCRWRTALDLIFRFGVQIIIKPILMTLPGTFWPSGHAQPFYPGAEEFRLGPLG